MINFMCMRSIRHLLDVDTTASLCLSLCISHIDYCNSLLYGIPQVSLQKLPRVQNMCACLVLRKQKIDSATIMFKGSALATNQTKNTLQNTDSYL